jgi:saccharopine dehydrogenase-like NADP-dependent oxidoreductase
LLKLQLVKHIVLFGAGKSATVLINYLKDVASEHLWRVTVADHDQKMVDAKVGKHPLTIGVALDIHDEVARQTLISKADIVISLMPPALHFIIAKDCLQQRKTLLTASYVDDQLKAMAKELEENNVLFICEMGLDPGIDHMSAMKIIDDIRNRGGKITSFRSHCGGLVAPESDTNPWHYKISWNPKNIILAGKAGASFKENGEKVFMPYLELFNGSRIVTMPDETTYAYYPNRDSLSYIPVYELEDAATFLRTTLRHPEFCFGWKNLIDLKLTDEYLTYDTDGLSVADFFRQHFEKHGFSNWLNEMLMQRLNLAKDMMQKLMELMQAEQEAINDGADPDEEELMLVDDKGELTTLHVDDVKDKAAETVAYQMHEANVSMKQLFFLGLDDEETMINMGTRTAAEVLQFVLERKLALAEGDKDMIVMLHEIEYELNGEKHEVKSSLVVEGDDHIYTAMAKTVGLPLGIAAKLILEEKIKLKGLHIPIIPEIYDPVLEALQQQDIIFDESDTALS